MTQTDPACTSRNFDLPHRRYNPLLDEWIIVSPNRTKRPWAGQLEEQKQYGAHLCEDNQDQSNPLAPGVRRASGIVTEHYTNTYIFPNDFPALDTNFKNRQNDSPIVAMDITTDPLFASAPAYGDCQVMCFHPRSDKVLSLMDHTDVVNVIKHWCKLTEEYANKKVYQWMQIFENRGAAVGSSNMHPHCQIWACAFLPTLAARRDSCQRKYFTQYKTPLLLDYATREIVNQVRPEQNRIIIHSSHWLVLVPWWACWPFETMIVPCQRHIRWLCELTKEEIDDLGKVMQQLLVRYDNLFETEFPYSMAWLQAPFMTNNSQDTSSNSSMNHWQLHAIYQPPLLRSATVRKFMSGFELVSEPQRDLLPETAAELLRAVPTHHYLLRKT